MTKLLEKVNPDLRGIVWLDKFEEAGAFFADFGSIYVAAYKQYYLEERTHTFEGVFSQLRVAKELIEPLVLSLMEKKDLRLIDCNYTITSESPDKIFVESAALVNDDSIVVVSNGDYVYIYTTDHYFLRELLLSLKEKFVLQKEASVNIIVKEMNGLALRTIPLEKRDFIESNYMPDCYQDLVKVQEATTKKDPFGRLSILAGPPGTGKTSFLKTLLSAEDATFLAVPSTYVNALEDSGLVQLFLQHRDAGKPLVLLIEDADGALEARNGASGDSRVCALLSALDGILSEVLDLRVVATTNLPIDNLDKALLRPGRLAHLVHVPKLDRSQAQEVAERLNPATILPPGDEISLAEVYGAANGADNRSTENVEKIAPRRRVGFGF